MYWRYVNQDSNPIIFEEAFFMATKGGGEFFGKVGSFEEGYEFDALVLDESSAPYVQDLDVMQRLERAIYLLLDTNGIVAKYVRGTQII
jgi:guanine deaminase